MWPFVALLPLMPAGTLQTWRRTGFEPVTCPSSEDCSVQLSYRCAHGGSAGSPRCQFPRAVRVGAGVPRTNSSNHDSGATGELDHFETGRS
jgi:hypothetical protein